MTKVNYKNAAFLLSAAKLNDLPPDKGREVAFIGRSNAGKSSSINTITSIKGLARTSKTPGRTQTINIYRLNDELRLVDLPGYGYAKVPLPIKEQWQENVNLYLKKRRCLQGLVVVMDIRHPLKESDQQLIEWAVGCEVPLHILLTKCDKLKRTEARQILKEVESALDFFRNSSLSIQLFSSLDGTGLEEAHQKLDCWFMDLEGLHD